MRVPAIRLTEAHTAAGAEAGTYMYEFAWASPGMGAVHAAWVAFATTGDPGWPRYEPGRTATMRFDTTSRVVEDPRKWERALWEALR
ncbi:hypothetical protein WMO79_15085 [Micrococcaceae bacterium Sec7.4]